jgi:hypothetical protein
MVYDPELLIPRLHIPGNWYTWVLPYSRRAHVARDLPSSVGRTCLEDMGALRRLLRRHYGASGPGFLTHFSVGCVWVAFRIRYEIFAIDGAREPCRYLGRVEATG